MPVKRIYLIFVAIGLLYQIPLANAQSLIKSGAFQQSVDAYQQAHPACPFYIHTDKNVYVNNESIWFSAYLLNRLPGEANAQHVLTISIFDPATQKMLIVEKFGMNKQLFTSRVILPDSLPTGHYQLIGNMDLVDNYGNALAWFSEPITVKNLSQKNFTANAILIDSTVKNDVVRVKLKVMPRDQKARIIPKASYQVGALRRSIMPLKNNELIIEVPKAELNRADPQFNATITYDKEVEQLHLQLPSALDKNIHIRFFPEGGDLVDGLPCRVAFEVQTADGRNLSVTGSLLKDNTALGNVKTNMYVMGTFEIEPDKKSQYYLKINAGDYFSRDTLVKLPAIADNLVSIQLKQAVVNDTLAIKLNVKQPQVFQIFLHNYQGDFEQFEIQQIPPGKQISLPLTKIPKGLAEITILDEQGRPLAERLFFAHLNDQITVDVKAEKPQYYHKENVNVNVKLKDNNGNPVQGIFSIAVVQESRINSGFKNIQDQYYLTANLGEMPPNTSGHGLYDKAYLENILLVKGWRRYMWRDLIANKYVDTNAAYRPLTLTGKVTYRGKLLKKPVSLVAIGGNGVGLITTKDDGTFIIDRKLLNVEEGKKVALQVTGDHAADYQIELDDSYAKLAQRIAEDGAREQFGIANNAVSGQDTAKIENTVHNLQMVTIKGSKGNGSVYAVVGPPGINNCGDYVDEFGYLNYAYSEHRFHPIPGAPYKIRTDLNDQRTSFKVDPAFYGGCSTEGKKDILQIDGIYGAREFYGIGESLSDSEFLSTLYWKGNVLTDKSGEAKLSFKTGEIGDRFRIVVEGITSDNVFSGTSYFVVK